MSTRETITKKPPGVSNQVLYPNIPKTLSLKDNKVINGEGMHRMPEGCCNMMINPKIPKNKKLKASGFRQAGNGFNP